MSTIKSKASRAVIFILCLALASFCIRVQAYAAAPPPEGTPCVGTSATDIMVRVGPLCVDKYEASVWSGPGGNFLLQAGAYALIAMNILRIRLPPASSWWQLAQVSVSALAIWSEVR